VNIEVEGSLGIGSHYQVKAGEDTADSEGLVYALVNCRAYELATVIQLLVVMTCKCSINPIT
jgi:hypothetical protein